MEIKSNKANSTKDTPIFRNILYFRSRYTFANKEDFDNKKPKKQRKNPNKETTKHDISQAHPISTF